MPYETTERDGHTLDILTNANHTLRLTVSRNGAEPVGLAKKNSAADWVGFLWRDGDVTKNPSGWNNHSTVMGYYIHRILNEKTQYRGHVIRGGTHSFIRHKVFDAPEVGENSLIYRLSAKSVGPEEYPFEVDFTLTYTLDDAGLRIGFGFDNREATESHVSFGLHPGFGVTSLADAVVLMPKGKYRRHIAPGNFLSGEIVEIDIAGGPMPFAKSDLPGSFLLDMAEVPERKFVVEDPVTGRRTTLDFSEAPYLTLWSDGNDFVCVEPCWGLPDHHEQRAFEDKLGIQVIPANGRLEAGFYILPELVS
ncbi:MAG TPA: hypothetical protein VIT91_08865 [Chthoniobacterales bacterium]